MADTFLEKKIPLIDEFINPGVDLTPCETRSNVFAKAAFIG
jgi:hypothetical protein